MFFSGIGVGSSDDDVDGKPLSNGEEEEDDDDLDGKPLSNGEEEEDVDGAPMDMDNNQGNQYSKQGSSIYKILQVRRPYPELELDSSNQSGKQSTKTK